jgi:hypothetical protein
MKLQIFFGLFSSLDKSVTVRELQATVAYSSLGHMSAIQDRKTVNNENRRRFIESEPTS